MDYRGEVKRQREEPFVGVQVTGDGDKGDAENGQTWDMFWRHWQALLMGCLWWNGEEMAGSQAGLSSLTGAVGCLGWAVKVPCGEWLQPQVLGRGRFLQGWKQDWKKRLEGWSVALREPGCRDVL